MGMLKGRYSLEIVNTSTILIPEMEIDSAQGLWYIADVYYEAPIVLSSNPEVDNAAKQVLEKVANDAGSDYSSFAWYLMGEKCRRMPFVKEKYLRKAYNGGFSQAALSLAWLYTYYDFGIDPKKNSETGNNSDSDSDSDFDLGGENKFRTRTSHYPNDNALYWLEKTIELQCTRYKQAYCRLGVVYSRLKRYKDAAMAWEKSFEEDLYLWGHREDSLRLADCYMHADYKVADAYKIGKRYCSDFSESQEWDKYEAWAATIQGKCYYRGMGGVQQSFDKAFKFFYAAANARRYPDSEAMSYLSACYRFGRGTPQNIRLADEWLEKAKKSNDERAKRAIELMNAI